jgi:hypothetical protein
MKEYSWTPILGEYRTEKDKITFIGDRINLEGKENGKVGNLVCDQFFEGGIISADT